MRACSFKDSGFLNIHKPSGPTSFQIVRIIRSKLNQKRVGHGGTLDPLASGVLVILFGKATSQSDLLMDCDKVYRCVMKLGLKTDTGDLGGNILKTIEFIPPNRNQVSSVLLQFNGMVQQTTPSYSAAKFRGRKLYEYARDQIRIPEIKRDVFIYSLDLLSFHSPFIEFRVRCSKGTYVRSLAEDIGEALGIPATVTGLIRERVGPFKVENSISWEDLEKMGREELLRFSFDGIQTC